jgi:aspartate/tyrosine/aromatic aminotransferase
MQLEKTILFAAWSKRENAVRKKLDEMRGTLCRQMRQTKIAEH